MRFWQDLLDGHGFPAVRRFVQTIRRTPTAEALVGGEATPSQIGGFLVAMRAKGETVEEITAFVETMYKHAAPLKIDRRVVDIVGTGGDDRDRRTILERDIQVDLGAVDVGGHGVGSQPFSDRGSQISRRRALLQDAS